MKVSVAAVAASEGNDDENEYPEQCIILTAEQVSKTHLFSPLFYLLIHIMQFNNIRLLRR